MIDQVINANIAASQTDSSLRAAVSGAKLAVMSLVIKSGGTATNVTLNSKPSGAGTAISPLLAMGINDDLVLPYTGVAWFYTNEGEGLTVTTGTGATTGISVRVRSEP